MQPEDKNTTMQYGLLQLVTLPAAAIFGFYANATEYILEYLVFPNAFDHAVNLQWSLIVWGLPEDFVHSYLSVSLYYAHWLGILMIFGLCCLLINSKTVDVFALVTIGLMPFVEIHSQLQRREYVLPSIGDAKARLLVWLIVALLVTAYFQNTSLRFEWGTRRIRSAIGIAWLLLLAVGIVFLNGKTA